MGGRTYHEEIETENKTTKINTREVRNYLLSLFFLFIIIRVTYNADSNKLFVHIAVKRTETCGRRCRGSYDYFVCDLLL